MTRLLVKFTGSVTRKISLYSLYSLQLLSSNYLVLFDDLKIQLKHKSRVTYLFEVCWRLLLREVLTRSELQHFVTPRFPLSVWQHVLLFLKFNEMIIFILLDYYYYYYLINHFFLHVSVKCVFCYSFVYETSFPRGLYLHFFSCRISESVHM